MSNYFSTVRHDLADAVERRAHLRWYHRLRVSHGRSLVLVFGVLAVATPALGAISGWFSSGRPDATGPVSAGSLYGIVRPGGVRMLPIHAADPQGGPVWGLRLVRTTRGDTCLQLGRVQAGQLGSLGIDDAWGNDHRFHPIPPSARATQACGSTDAAGHGFVSRGVFGESASANPVGDFIRGPQAGSCRPALLTGPQPACPKDGNRIVFYGLLGPDAVSITYRTLGGGIATQPVTKGVGAYLLVFPYNTDTCREYANTHNGDVRTCSGEVEGGGPGPVVPGAVTKVTYTRGRTCSLVPPSRTPGFRVANEAFLRSVYAKIGTPASSPAASGILGPSAHWRAAYRRLLDRFLAREHLTQAQYQAEGPGGPQCPAVGFVPFAHPTVRLAQVATAVHLRKFPVAVYGCPNQLHLPGGCDGIGENGRPELPVEWTFTARRAVTNSHSYYQWWLQPPPGCGGATSYATDANIRAGQTLRYSTFLPAGCHGIYNLTIGYTPQALTGATDEGSNATFPGQNGSIIIGHAHFNSP